MVTQEIPKPPRPTAIPAGKYQGAPIVWLSPKDLATARREFSRVDPTVQGAIMSELARRERSDARRRKRSSLRRWPQRGIEQSRFVIGAGCQCTMRWEVSLNARP